MVRRQLTARMMPRGHFPAEIKIIGGLPRHDRDEWLRHRIIAIVRTGDQWEDGWPHGPGVMNWSAVRVKVGGRVSASEFIAAVDALIADGRLIEVWLKPRGRCRAPHLLMLPGKSAALTGPVVQARGTAAVLDREPWASGLA